MAVADTAGQWAAASHEAGARRSRRGSRSQRPPEPERDGARAPGGEAPPPSARPDAPSVSARVPRRRQARLHPRGCLAGLGARTAAAAFPRGPRAGSREPGRGCMASPARSS